MVHICDSKWANVKDECVVPRYILRGCPRCAGGDLILEGYVNPRELAYVCFQCSHMILIPKRGKHEEG